MDPGTEAPGPKSAEHLGPTHRASWMWHCIFVTGGRGLEVTLPRLEKNYKLQKLFHNLVNTQKMEFKKCWHVSRSFQFTDNHCSYHLRDRANGGHQFIKKLMILFVVLTNM